MAVHPTGAFTAARTGGASSRDILVVAPWLEGGGGQAALRGILEQLPTERVHVAVLFGGNRHYDEIRQRAGSFTMFGFSRGPAGALRAARALRPLLRPARAVYSLMRGSHVVLGLLPRRTLRALALAATFHQLPSEDARSPRAAVEDVLVRRALRSARVVTAPSDRAVREIVERRLAPAAAVRAESNIMTVDSADAPPPRAGRLRPLRLVFVGRMAEQKGLDRIPELLRGVEVPVELRLVGDGELVGEAAALAAADLAPHVVTYAGRSDDVAAHLDWADALFLPSRWELNPVAVWEAWARGRGVVASDLPVFADLAGRGPVWTFRDPAGLGQRLAQLADSEDLRRDAADRGRRAFETNRREGRVIADFLAGHDA